MTADLGKLASITGSPLQHRLITPYSDGLAAFQAYLGLVQKKWRTIIYGDTHPVFFDAALAFWKTGGDFKAILDHTQSCGPHEKAQVQKWLDAGMKDGEQFVIGTSPEAHEIIHLKSTWLDDRWVEDGSLNYSPSALKEVNSICVMDWPEYAAYLNTNVFDVLWKWIVEHEEKYQVV